MLESGALRNIDISGPILFQYLVTSKKVNLLRVWLLTPSDPVNS